MIIEANIKVNFQTKLIQESKDFLFVNSSFILWMCFYHQKTSKKSRRNFIPKLLKQQMKNLKWACKGPICT